MGSTPFYAAEPPAETLDWDPAAGYPPDHVRLAIGSRIQAKLTEKGWKQSELARRADIGRDSVSLYIRGKNTPTAGSLSKIAAAFGCSISDLAPELRAATSERIKAAGQQEREFELLSVGDGKARLRIDKIIPQSLAFKILSMIEEGA